ncbi:MAG: YbhB/YbcL family Raf kinase inhibitor-like protein [Polyangiaceae bacterium]|jgi:Raf kinase inhibitor-like YbhB/YbcL family protein
MTSGRSIGWLVGSAAAAFIACRSGGRPSTPPGVTLASLSVTSKTFISNGAIPVDDSCDGADRSPQLTWSAPPAGTRALAIVVDDPDAIGGEFTHWLAYNLAPTTSSLPEGVDSATLGGDEGTNSFGRVGYAGPCPPRREMHRYEFHVFALDAPLAARPGATREQVDDAMSQHVIAEGTLVGTFAH